MGETWKRAFAEDPIKRYLEDTPDSIGSKKGRLRELASRMVFLIVALGAISNLAFVVGEGEAAVLG